MSSTPHRIYFDRWAAHYDRDLNRFGYTVPGLVAQLLSPHMQEGMRVLDAGIGTGLVADAIRRAMPDVEIAGIDLSPRMLSLCRARGFSDVYACDAGNQIWPYRDGHFDAVTAAGLLEFIENPMWFLAQGARVLKPGGLFILAFETIESAPLYKPGLLRGITRHTPECATVRRLHYTPLPRLYNKYLHNPWFIEQIAQKLDLAAVDRRTGTAYRRPNGDAVSHDVIVFRKN